MCRMVFATGEFEPASMIDGVILMAADQNERHEENANQLFKHADGWGLCYLENNQLKIFRSVKPVFDDPLIDQFRKLKTNLFILHARYGTRGEINIKNVHPFEHFNGQQHYVFFHNGTVRDQLAFDNQYKPNGKTDSEHFFYYLIDGDTKNLTVKNFEKKIEKLKNFSGANFVLTTGEITFIANWYSLNPLYYTLKILKSEKATIVSSEILPNLEGKNLQKFSNHQITSLKTIAPSI